MANTKVQSEQIEDGSITADKLADGTIVAAELADNAVTTAKINADAVTGAKIADDAIDSEHYTDGSIDTAHIADSQITVAKMAANSVDSDQFVDGSIDTVHIADSQVTTAKIADGNISTAKIADNAVTSAKIDTNIDIAGTFDVTGATVLDSTLTVAGATTLAGDVDIDATDDLRLRFLNGGTFKGGIQVPTSSGDMISGSAVDDLAIRSQGNILFSSGGNTEHIRIDSSGRVLIGNSTSSAHANTDDLQVGNTTGNHGIQINAANTGNSSIFFGDNDSTLTGQLEYVHASDYLAIITGGNQRLRVDAHGLKFGTDSAAANALDDYEEGSWNPTLIAGTTNPTGGAYQARYGRYSKIGNRVFVTFYVGISWTNSPSGGIYMGNLPYTVANDATTATHFPIVSYNLDINGVGAFGVAIQNQTNVQIYMMANSGAWAAASWQSHVTTPLYIAGEFSYAVS